MSYFKVSISPIKTVMGISWKKPKVLNSFALVYYLHYSFLSDEFDDFLQIKHIFCVKLYLKINHCLTPYVLLMKFKQKWRRFYIFVNLPMTPPQSSRMGRQHDDIMQRMDRKSSEDRSNKLCQPCRRGAARILVAGICWHTRNKKDISFFPIQFCFLLYEGVWFQHQWASSKFI